jgi:hypothetical protein
VEGKLELEAQLVINLNGDSFVLVAEGNYIILNFTDLKTLERIIGAGKKPASQTKVKAVAPKTPGGNPLKKLNELNSLIRRFGLVVDVRVGNNTYVEFGSGNSARITAAAIFGKIGSFFGK